MDTKQALESAVVGFEEECGRLREVNAELLGLVSVWYHSSFGTMEQKLGCPQWTPEQLRDKLKAAIARAKGAA